MTRLAFIGLGAMGLRMAKRLVAAGHAVVGYDIASEPLAALRRAGGEAAPTAREAATGATALVLMVVNAAQAETVLFSDGAAAALADGALVILCATCPPAEMQAIGERLAAMNRDFLDAPVSGGIVGAEAGTLTIMVGGPATVFRRAEPILSVLGDKRHHIGEAWGAGAAMKTVNQLLCGIHIAAAAEGLSLAARLGIDPAVALPILGRSAAASWMLNDRGPRMLQPAPPVTSAVDIFVKDLGIVLNAGEAARMGLPLAALARQLFLAASGSGLGRADDSQVIAVYRSPGPVASATGAAP